MGFRLRRSTRLGPLRFNFSSGGLRSISTGEQLGEHGLVSRLLAYGSLGARMTGLLAVIETPGRCQTPCPALHHGRAGSLQAGLCTGLALLTLQEQVPAGPVPRIRPYLRSHLSRPRMEPERRR